MSPCLQETSDTSLSYIHVGSYISQLSFSSLTFPTHLCYNFPCIRGCLRSLWRFKTFIIWINEVVLTAPLLLLYHTSQFEYSLICEKFPFSTSFLWVPSRPGKHFTTLDPKSEKLCCLNSPFVLLKSNMDQHAVKGQASLLFSTALYFAFLSMFTDDSATKKNLNKQHTQPQNYRLLQFAPTYRAFQKTARWPPSIMKLVSVAGITSRPTSSISFIPFSLV